MSMRKGVKRSSLLAAVAALAGGSSAPPAAAGQGARRELLASFFTPSGQCLACHNGLVTRDGQDVSIGTDWRSSMMANSARDPYWQAAVSRETLDHPSAHAEIQDECSICHMPMAQFLSHQRGELGQVFANLPVGQVRATARAPDPVLAADGVSCSLCHQIGPQRLGTRASFVGGFVIDTARGRGNRPVYGPYETDNGRSLVMKSSSGFVPTKGAHVESSELCATCHTLYTHTRGANGEVIGELPEQVPYLEWKHSAYPREQRSCQSCHMPPLGRPAAISSVLPQERPGMSPHVFRGGNAFMAGLLNRYRHELGVVALPAELAETALRTTEFLRQQSARLSLVSNPMGARTLAIDVMVENLAGHKLPTAYPSRRAWLHVVVTDARGRVLFESGALNADGSIAGNDNDADADRFEPHYTLIERADQVQVYEPILGDPRGCVTTGLLTASHYLKDNRLLPRGFDRRTAPKDAGVHGAARRDADFASGGDRVRYVVSTAHSTAPFSVMAELYYQPIGFRWAMNLQAYDATLPRRFVRYYRSMGTASSVRLAATTATVSPSGNGPR